MIRLAASTSRGMLARTRQNQKEEGKQNNGRQNTRSKLNGAAIGAGQNFNSI